jgi:hypothetical protein
MFDTLLLIDDTPDAIAQRGAPSLRGRPASRREAPPNLFAAPASCRRASSRLRAFGESENAHAMLSPMTTTAREFTDRLATLLRREHEAMADFLGASSNLGNVLD